MSSITPTDQLLNKSFRLAYFILGDRMASMYLTAAALDKLKIASAAQGRRLQYVPTGGSTHHAVRTKVSLSRLHLLQRLIYKEAEAFERLQEAQEAPLGQRDMIIRFVKHLAMVTTRRNSFHVSLGLCRLLYNYTTAETSDIYNLLLQDPDRSRDEHYFRSRKVRLMREFGERFGESLQLRRGHRGEERFEPQEDSSKYLSLIGECLSRFTPWDSPCVLPPDTDPAYDVSPLLLSNGGSPGGEHEEELNRIHSLLHPACFERLTATLGLAPPSRRLEVPRFFDAADDRGLPDDRLEPRPLRAEELDVLRRHLERNEAQRAETPRRLLAVLVDGEERARFHVSAKGRVRVKAAADSAWLEVRSVEEEETVTLAMHQVSYRVPAGAPRRPSLTRGPGYTLSFEAQQTGDDPAPGAGQTVIVGHRERGAAARIFSLPRRLGALLKGGAATAPWAAVGHPRLALATVLITACAAGLLLYFASRRKPPAEPPPGGRDLIAQRDVHDGGAPTAPPTPGQPAPNVESPRGAQSAAGRAAQGVGRAPESNTPRDTRREPVTPDEPVEDETTRAPEVRPASRGLLSVRLVYVDLVDGGAAAEGVREAIVKELAAAGRFAQAVTREGSDAVLEGAVTRLRGGERVSVRLRLVNARGDVVWPTTTRRPWATYTGRGPDVTARIVADIVGEVRRLEGRR